MKTKSLREELGKLKKNRQSLAILVLLFVCVIFWTGVTLITSQQSSKIDADLTKASQPINPTIDVQVLEKLEGKNQYSDAELNNFTIYKIITSRIDRIDRVVTIDTSLESVEEELTTQQSSQTTNPSPSPDSSPNPDTSPPAVSDDDQTGDDQTSDDQTEAF